MLPNSPNTYLGNKGYTISKADLTVQKEKKIREDLMICPRVHGAPINNNLPSFPAYRESNNKMYVPHYYGVEHFGPPAKIKISDGLPIELPFSGQLRENQEIVVKTYVDHVTKCGTGGGLLELPCAYGKCLGIDTEILMYDGTIKKVQDVVDGDLLMGDDSTPRTVLSLARGREQMYKVETQKGDGYIVNESHILSLKCATNHSKALKKGTVVDMSVLDYLNLPKSFHGKGGVLYGYRVPINFPETLGSLPVDPLPFGSLPVDPLPFGSLPVDPLPFDPYMIGYWLGDGSSRGSKISCQDSTVLHYFAHNLKKYNLSLVYSAQYDYNICGNHLVGNNTMLNTLRNLNLLKNKHIPLIYKCNSRENRLKLLAGLLDSDGHLTKGGGFEFTQKNERLIDEVIYLARSLGFSCDKKLKNTSWTYKGDKKYGTAFRTTINGQGLEEIPTIIPRKKSPPRRQIKDVLNYRIKLTKLEVDDYYGFEIDGNRRFVLGDFTVTHNTVLSLNIISRLKKKTFIIVHKEFLMNQWIERIGQFLPNTRVGKIQGQVIDIDNKDIVIGMLQSLSMKEYPQNLFDSFGLTIIDEVHHISSEVFSNTLFKLVTKYMLGLSATMERKDGTTKVFKMFLGNVVFKGGREEQHKVVVRAIEYKVNDDEFNEVKLDFRGKPAYSSMISKLCEYNRRTEFILKVLTDMLQENPAQQIMILAHNKNVLKYLYDAITHRQIAPVGYYLGGMKEKALKETEGKQIVIATYAMAAEALDIKTLTTLIMATPKTDIEQSVGRILRDKHSSPTVVDIIDAHDLFKNQWRKRKTFYKKENYKIIYTTSVNYVPDIKKWDLVFSPTDKLKDNKKSTDKSVKQSTNKLSKKKSASEKSNSSTDKSITCDSEEELDVDEDEDNKGKGKCLLAFKKPTSPLNAPY
jgi:superfamily II DNA or RNA helicase